MTLDHTQRERLSEALIDAFPSYESLKRMAAYKLNINLEACTGSRKLSDCVFDLIEHMCSHGRLEDLVRGACQGNLGNEQLRAFAKDYLLVASDPLLSLPPLNVTPYGVAHQRPATPGQQAEEDIPTVRMSSPTHPLPVILDRALRTLLINALLNTPLAASFEGRSQLLSGVPGAMTLNRVQGNARLDLEEIVDQLCLRGIASNQQMPLLILVNNALPYVEGYEVGDALQRVRSELTNY